jgi:hypothetical protein
MPRYKDFEEKFDAMRDEQRHGRQERPERGEKKSWRDLDRRRDQSAHSDQDKRPHDKKHDGNRYQEAQAAKEIKTQLDGLFGDKVGDALTKAILEAVDRSALQAAIQKYSDERGTLPADPSLLEKALDCRNDKMMRTVIADIATHLPDLDAVHRKVLLLKMKTKARTSFDRKVTAAVKELIDEYGAPD